MKCDCCMGDVYPREKARGVVIHKECYEKLMDMDARLKKFKIWLDGWEYRNFDSYNSGITDKVRLFKEMTEMIEEEPHE